MKGKGLRTYKVIRENYHKPGSLTIEKDDIRRIMPYQGKIKREYGYDEKKEDK